MDKHWDVALLVATVTLLACGHEPEPPRERRVSAESVPLAAGEVWGWARLDGELVVDVGLSFNQAALDTLAVPLDLTVPVPEQAQAQSFVRELQLRVEQSELGPERLEVLFHRLKDAERSAIDCVGEPEPAPDQLPPGFAMGDTRVEPEGSCEPTLGVPTTMAAAEGTQLASVQQWNFELGFHNGLVSYLAPSMALDLVQSGASADVPVPIPERFGFSTRWPTHLTLRKNEYDQELDIGLLDFRPVD